MKIFSYFYTSLVLALGLAMVCFGTKTWQMMMNTGYVFFGCTIVLFIVMLIFGRKAERGIGPRGAVAALLTACLMGFVYLTPKGMLVGPAALIREGLGMRHLPLNTVNIILALVLVAGFAAIVYYEVKNPRPKEEMDPDQEKLERTASLTRWITFGVVFVLVTIASCIPSVRATFGQIFSLLGSGDIEAVAAYIRSYGIWAALVSASLMVLQSLAAPIPAFLITLSNSIVFGWWQGAILSWSSAMVGAAVCFYIARLLGRDAVAHFVSHSALQSVDKFFERYGKNAILICRLLPFMSFDYVSYAAGLTGMGFWDFFIATGVGQAPATIVYSYVGGMLTGGARLMFLALVFLFALFALIWLFRMIFKNRNQGMLEEEQEDEAKGAVAVAAAEAGTE